MTGTDLEKSQNYNEPGRTLHESSFVEIVESYFSTNMTGINMEKSQNYNEPGRTSHESSFVEIVA
ncbi:hypothetical protein T11_342 [Trichinella zimbabwensis]|uniref:Uncharacterized protein n=1 Tax=Trichinella zimbabwensis TaxID=268475 RepID=A0A0V1HBB3_9BILA|nr:hypothetical protein T11_342 [Trichinella zimbabwensis]